MVERVRLVSFGRANDLDQHPARFVAAVAGGALPRGDQEGRARSASKLADDVEFVGEGCELRGGRTRGVGHDWLQLVLWACQTGLLCANDAAVSDAPCRPLPQCRLPGPAHLPPALQAPARRLELRVAAAFLLHQVELHSSHRLGGGEDLLPRADPLAEQYAKALLLRLRARRPVLEVKASDAARMALDPRNRVLAGFETGPDVELEDELRRSVRGENVHDPL